MSRKATRLLLLFALLIWAGGAAGIERAEVMDRAKAYCTHPWTCMAANLQASCLTAYTCEFVVGDHMGLPYDWGGFVSLHGFVTMTSARGDRIWAPCPTPYLSPPSRTAIPATPSTPPATS